MPDQQAATTGDLCAFFTALVQSICVACEGVNKKSPSIICIAPFHGHKLSPLFVEERGYLFHIGAHPTRLESASWYTFFRDRAERRTPFFLRHDCVERFDAWELAIRSFLETTADLLDPIMRECANHGTLTFYLPIETAGAPLLEQKTRGMVAITRP
jgi:hypothetical protein